MTAEKKTFRPLTSADVCEIYELLYSERLVSFPLTKEARQKIDAIISSVNTPYFGVERYAAIGEKAAAYLYFLIKDHPFTDGNKRTAVLSCAVFCALNHLKPNEKSFGLDELAVYLEQNRNNHEIMIQKVATVLFNDDFLT